MLCYNCSPQPKTFLENHLKLNPPIFHNYSIQEFSENYIKKNKRSILYSEVKFIHNIYNNINYPFINIHCYTIKKITDKNKKLICLYLKNISNINNNKNNININNNINDSLLDYNIYQNNNLTIVYSHDINTDIGKIFPILLDMCQNLKCDFVTYDYSGYGKSEGKPHLDKFNNDLEEVINFINTQLCIPFENLILYGKFIGCHPSIYISSLSKYCNIRGLILESPIYIDENNENENENEFKKYLIDNYNCLKYIIAPTFLIYGKMNKMVNYEKIQFLESQINECISWYPNHGKHYDIITQYRINFYEKFKSFINYIKKTKLKIRKSIIQYKNDSIFTNESKFIINNSK